MSSGVEEFVSHFLEDDLGNEVPVNVFMTENAGQYGDDDSSQHQPLNTFEDCLAIQSLVSLFCRLYCRVINHSVKRVFCDRNLFCLKRPRLRMWCSTWPIANPIWRYWSTSVEN